MLGSLQNVWGSTPHTLTLLFSRSAIVDSHATQCCGAVCVCVWCGGGKRGFILGWLSASLKGKLYISVWRCSYCWWWHDRSGVLAGLENTVSVKRDSLCVSHVTFTHQQSVWMNGHIVKMRIYTVNWSVAKPTATLQTIQGLHDIANEDLFEILIYLRLW